MNHTPQPPQMADAVDQLERVLALMEPTDQLHALATMLADRIARRVIRHQEKLEAHLTIVRQLVSSARCRGVCAVRSAGPSDTHAAVSTLRALPALQQIAVLGALFAIRIAAASGANTQHIEQAIDILRRTAVRAIGVHMPAPCGGAACVH